MKKSILTLSTALMAGGLLVGCGTDNNRNGVNDNATPRQVGYYTDNNRYNGDNGRYNNLAYDHNGLPNNNNIVGNNDNNTTSAYDTELSRRIQSQVTRLSGVNDASVLVNQNTVYVAVDTNNNDGNTQDIQGKVRTTVKSITRDRNVRVVTDANMVRRIGDVNDRLANGSAYREVQSDINGIINDIGDALKRPFTNNAQ